MSLTSMRPGLWTRSDFPRTGDCVGNLESGVAPAPRIWTRTPGSPPPRAGRGPPRHPASASNLAVSMRELASWKTISSDQAPARTALLRGLADAGPEDPELAAASAGPGAAGSGFDQLGEASHLLHRATSLPLQPPS